jgi:diamine N-acetyltransferase
VGILIADPSDRRKGYAREALETLVNYCSDILNLHQLYCNIEADNEASIALFKGLGFVEAGRKTDWIFTGKGYNDELLYQKILG